MLCLLDRSHLSGVQLSAPTWRAVHAVHVTIPVPSCLADRPEVVVEFG